jgi:predicted ester cyclase
MAPDDLKSRARRVVEEVLNQGDLAVANELISPDCVQHIPGGLSRPGLAALRERLALTLSIFPDFHAIVEDEIAEDDLVVQRITCYGTHQGECSGIRPTGRPVSFEIIEISRVGADGKFAERWSSADLPGVLRQLAGPARASGPTADVAAHGPGPSEVS